MFLYQKVYSQLKDQIIRGETPNGTILPSERELGEIYHVDRTTIRKAFQILSEENLVSKHAGKGTIVTYSGQPQAAPPASPGVPGPQASPSGVCGNGTIAFLLPKSNRNSDRITVPFYSQLFSSVETCCRRLGFSLMYSTLDETDDLQTILEQNGSRITGIMFVSNIAEKHIDQAIRMAIPAVLTNSSSGKTPSIVADNFSGTYGACQHLIRLGHRDICVLNGIEQYHSAHERLEGVLSAMKNHGLPLPGEFIISGDSWEFEGGFHAVSSLLRQSRKLPTGIIAFNDRLASGALQAVQQAGLRVPEDISIIGFDNSELAMYSVPKLSSVEINIPLMAKASVASLFSQMKLGETLPVKIQVPVSYIERDSVAEARYSGEQAGAEDAGREFAGREF